MAFRMFKGLGQINRPSAASIRRRTYRVTNRIGLKPWTLPILLTAIKSLWLREQRFLEGGESENLPPFPSFDSAHSLIDSEFISTYPFGCSPISYFDRLWSLTLTWLGLATDLGLNLNDETSNITIPAPQAEMNDSAIGPVVMILTLLNQYIDAITHGILDILYSFTSAIPLLGAVVWPISLLLRLRIHLAPQKSFFGGILAPLKLGGCENVTSAVVAGAGAWWLYGNCRPFRRVVINIKRRGRKVLGALKRFDLAGVVKAVIMDPDAVAKGSNGFRR
ncbi:hypothetical protein TWF106_009512 [Orbilia oligospora]|uniref:Uncharacterized protein n=2 Tax=Orbilia oligospora TaxID=2813651 RepID=A0A6G1MK99_ORBOL|nr:hypothetical protein TWF106_009512 [Orbilia oligospora]KAF3260615.1 hypothetical protein TWF192_009896 [Orbilia oligospora]